jgi:hypothetical protein
MRRKFAFEGIARPGVASGIVKLYNQPTSYEVERVTDAVTE